MASKSFSFRLITPLGKLLDTQVESVRFPGHDGLVGILANRAPLVMKLGAGPLNVDFAAGAAGAVGGGSKLFYIEAGFAHMVANKLTVLTAKAVAQEDLSESAAASELAAAKSEKASKGETAAERHRTRVEQARAKLAVARSASGKAI